MMVHTHLIVAGSDDDLEEVCDALLMADMFGNRVMSFHNLLEHDEWEDNPDPNDLVFKEMYGCVSFDFSTWKNTPDLFLKRLAEKWPQMDVIAQRYETYFEHLGEK